VGDEDIGGESARKGGSITMGLSRPPDSLDPALAATPQSREALWLVYTPPLTYKRAEGRDGTRLVPGLAERLPEISSDGSTYRFRFRKGLRYSDGTRLRAGDFAREITRVRRLRSPLRRLYSGVRRISADDSSRRVTIGLARPDTTFLNVLALPSSAPVSRRRPPAGIGPYAVVSRSRDGGYLMTRNRRFHLPGVPAGNVDEIDARVAGTSARQARAVISGRLDYTQSPAPAELLPELRSEYRDRYREHPTGSTYYYLLNPRRRPFDDGRVRKAVAYAVDGQKLGRLFAGRLDPSCNFLPREVPGYRRLQPCPYGERTAPPNLEKARALVESAGAQRAKVRVLGPAGGEGPRITRYYAATLRKLGLAARAATGPNPPPRRTQTAVAVRFGDRPNPASYFSALEGRTGDRAVDAAIRRLRREPRVQDVEGDWAGLDRKVVEDAYVATFGSERLGVFLSERLDSENCARFHQVYGTDYSSFCLK
jgi:peptide/nickel transport system substrate-binding protein